MIRHCVVIMLWMIDSHTARREKERERRREALSFTLGLYLNKTTSDLTSCFQKTKKKKKSCVGRVVSSPRCWNTLIFILFPWSTGGYLPLARLQFIVGWSRRASQAVVIGRERHRPLCVHIYVKNCRNREEETEDKLLYRGLPLPRGNNSWMSLKEENLIGSNAIKPKPMQW